MLTLINKENYLLDQMIRVLEKKFIKEGGYTENLFRKRLRERNKSNGSNWTNGTNKKGVAKATLLALLLNLCSPLLVWLPAPVQAKEPTRIVAVEKTDNPALFEAKERYFKVEFGDKNDETKHRVRFEAAPEISENLPEEATPAAEVKKALKERPFLEKAEEWVKGILGREDRLGVEFSLVEAGVVEAGVKEASLKDTSDGGPKGLLRGGGIAPKEALSPLQQGIIDSLNAQLEEIASESAKIEEKVEKVKGEVAGIVSEARQVYAKTELTQEKDKDVIQNVEVVDGVDVKYQIIEGKGVKEEIVLKENESYGKECFNSLSCSLPKNVFTFNLKLDPGVQLHQSLTGTKERQSGTWYFTDEYGRYLGHFLPPFAKDGKDNQTNNVQIEIKPIEESLSSFRRMLERTSFRELEGDINQEYKNQDQSGKNLNVCVDGPKTSRIHDAKTSSSLTVNHKKSVPKNRLYVNTPKSAQFLRGEKFGTIKTAPNQPADKLIDNPDNALSQGGEKNFSIKNTLTKLLSPVKLVRAVENVENTSDGGPKGLLRGGGNEYLLTVTVDLNWLLDPSRVFPIRIDPSVVHDTEAEFDAADSLNRVESIAGPIVETSYHELPADKHTVGLWHMNETANNSCSGGEDVCDTSGNGRHGTETGGVAIETSNQKLGPAARDFDGVDDYVSFTSVAQNQITVEAWVKSDSKGDSDYPRILVMPGYRFSFARFTGNEDDVVSFVSERATTDGEWLTPVNSIGDGVWYHVAATYDSSSTGNDAVIYINGVSQTITENTTPSGAQTSNAGTGYIGNSSAQDRSWDGLIDEVRISNTALTPEEIKANAQRRPYGVYTSDVLDLTADVQSIDSLQWTENGVQTGDGETAANSTGLVASWNYNETSGTTAANAASGTTCGTTCNLTLNNFANTTGQDVAAGSGWTANNLRWGAGAIMLSDVATADSLSVANPASNYLDPNSNDYSIEGWIKTTDTSAEIFSNNNANGTACTNNGVYLGIDANGYPVFNLDTNGATAGCDGSITGTSKVNDGNWHHLAVSVTRGTSATMYLDGYSIGSDTSITSYSSIAVTGTVYFGGSAGGLNGVLDAWRVYADNASADLTANQILSDSQPGNIEFQTRSGSTSSPPSGWEAWKPTTSETQIDSLDHGQYDTSDANMVSYWKMDESSWTNDCSTNTAMDSKGTNHGKACPNTTGPTGGATGRFSKAGDFDGSNDYLNMGDPAGGDFDFGTGDFSVEAWVKTDNQGFQVIASKVNSDTNNGFSLRMNTSSSYPEIILDDNSSYKVIANHTIDDGNWHHVAAVRSGDNLYIYVDGLLSNSSTGVDNVDISGTESFNIGRRETAAGGYWNGVIDEVAVYNDARTAAEIAADAYWSPDRTNNSVAGGINPAQDTTTYIEGSGSEKMTIGAPQLDDNVVALWHLEETNGDLTGDDVFDETTNNNDGEIVGTTVVDGIFGKARDLNGSSDEINVGAVSGLQGGLTRFTIEAWVNADAVSGLQEIVRKLMSSSQGQFLFRLNNANVEFGIRTTVYDSVVTTASLSTDTWYHLAGVWDGTNRIIYINGASSISEGNTGTMDTDADHLTIGCLCSDNDGVCETEYFNGTVDEVRISNVARTAEEIAEAYRAGKDHRLSRTISSTDLSSKTKLPFYVAADRPGTYLEATIGESALANYEPDANTVGLWHLEDQSGSEAYVKDSSSYGNNGTPTGTTFVQGKLGKARSFNGSSDYVQVTGSTSLKPTSVTAEAWIKTNSTDTSGEEVISMGDSYAVRVYTSGTVSFFIYDGSDWVPFATSTKTVLDGNWHYVVGLKDAGNNLIKIYVDGALEASVTRTSAISYTLGANFFIGKHGNASTAYDFNGTIDEVRISNTARTADQIRQAYEVGRRTHPITIDFASAPNAVDIAGTSEANAKTDTSFVIADDQMIDNIFVSDTVQVKENYGGTEYIVYGTVTAITTATRTITVASWTGTVPNPGTGVCGGSNTHCYTTGATVFKWQREWVELSDRVLSTHLDGITKITLRVTDGSEGRTFWLDDFKSGGAYLTDGTATGNVTSTVQRYMQYGFFVSSWDTAVTPYISSVTVNYTTGPAMEQVMRHGKWFSSGVKQPFWWAR